jgi:hypothetical protein
MIRTLAFGRAVGLATNAYAEEPSVTLAGDKAEFLELCKIEECAKQVMAEK